MDFVTGVGRIVWGNPLNGRKKTDNNNNVILGDDGQPIMQWAFGVAFPKNESGGLIQAMQQEAASVFPNGIPNNFAWKLKDGDGLDDQGKPMANREGHAGNYILAISTEAFAPKCVRLNGNTYSEMMEGIKTGDYVRVALNLKAHAGKQGVRGSVPGLYVNPQLIEFIGYGEAIIAGPDPMAVFGGQHVALPPGASAVPTASGPMPGQQPMQGVMPVNPSQQPGMPMGSVPGAVPQGMQPVASTVPVQTAYPSSGQPVAQQPQPGYPANPMPGNAPAGVPGAVQQPMNPVGQQPQPGYALPTASPTNQPVQPAHDFIPGGQQ